MLDKIIYVVGSRRSGSSVIYNAISSNSFFNPGIPENHLVPKLTEYCFHQIYRNKLIEKNYFFDSEKDIKKYFKDCIEKFFIKISKKYNVNNLILKSIAAAPNISFINMIYPGIHYVMTVRDPRDIVVSMINIGKKQENSKLVNQYPRNIKKLCDVINFSYRLFFDKNHKEFIDKNVLIIKYEDFVERPLFILNNFANKFSLDICYEKNSEFWKRSLSSDSNQIEDETLPYQSSLWNKPISKERINIYKNILTQTEINEINQYCKKVISYFNY